MENNNQWIQNSSTLTFLNPMNFSIKHNFAKRTFDILFSFLILTLSLPLLAIVALIVRFSSKGKIVYSHERIGRGGKPFKCYKFRTMYADADSRLNEIINRCPTLKKEWEQYYKLKNDPRVTPVGKFLRKTSLDEFPQFWNVLKGDLSVVGPRPVVQDEIAKFYGQKALKILSIRPGLTGLWQISGRNDICYSKRISMDEYYLEKQSLYLDIKIVAKTIPSIFFSKGAY